MNHQKIKGEDQEVNTCSTCIVCYVAYHTGPGVHLLQTQTEYGFLCDLCDKSGQQMQLLSFYKNGAKTNKKGRKGINFPNFMILLHMACRVTHVTNIHHYGTS